MVKHTQTIRWQLCAIWYHLQNCEKVKNTHGGALLLVTLQTEARDFTKRTLLHVFFHVFLNRTNGTKSGKASQIYFA